MYAKAPFRCGRASLKYVQSREHDWHLLYGSSTLYAYLEKQAKPVVSTVLSWEEFIEDRTFLRGLVHAYIQIVLFPGLTLCRSCVVATEHVEPVRDVRGDVCGRRTAIHFNIIGRDLFSGHIHGAFNSIRDYGRNLLFRDYVNARYGFSDPTMSERKTLYFWSA
jgi:hypothetical protein